MKGPRNTSFSKAWQGGPFTPTHKVFGGFWKTRVMSNAKCRIRGNESHFRGEVPGILTTGWVVNWWVFSKKYRKKKRKHHTNGPHAYQKKSFYCFAVLPMFSQYLKVTSVFVGSYPMFSHVSFQVMKFLPQRASKKYHRKPFAASETFNSCSYRTTAILQVNWAKLSYSWGIATWVDDVGSLVSVYIYICYIIYI